MGLVGLLHAAAPPPAATWCSARRRTSWPRRSAGWSGSRTTAAPSPPAPTSPTCSPPGPCATPRASTCRRCASPSTAPSRSTPTPSSVRRRGRRRTACAPAPSSRPSAWPRSPIAGTFPPPMRGLRHRLRRPPGPRDRALRRARRRRRRGRPPPRPARPARARASRCASSTPTRARCWPTARSASSRSAARRSPPATTATPRPPTSLFHDGWLRTGDLAYLLDGELVVCGRIKDVIIVGGRNVFPEDVERAVADVDGVRAGNVIAFGVDGRQGKEGLVVVAETKVADDEADPRAAPSPNASGRPSASPPRRSCWSTPGTLPKTSSGKFQRSLCKQRYLDEELSRV